MKRLLGKLVLVWFGLLLALGLAEGALRVFPLPDLRVAGTTWSPPGAAWQDPTWSDPPGSAFLRHRTLGHEHAPNTDVAVALAEHEGGKFRFRTNNLGLRRDNRTSKAKPPETFRVLILGDSHTDGYVDNPESFASQLEAEMAGSVAATGKRLEVLNGGVVDYSTAQEFLWYDVNGRELNPDLVVVIFYAGNDVHDLRKPSKPDVDPMTGRAVRPRELDHSESPDLLDDARLATLARYAVQVGPFEEVWRQFGLPGRSSGSGSLSPETLVQIYKTCIGCYQQSLHQSLHARRDPAGMRAAVEHAGALLALLGREVHQEGGRLAVGILPSRAQVEPELARPLQRSVQALIGLEDEGRLYEDEAVSTLSNQLSGVGIPTLMLQDSLAAAARTREPLYYSRDWHLNARGHRIVALALARGLSDLGLVPVP